MNRPSRLPDAVVFDFDGILVDTERLHHLAFQRVLEPEGLGFGWDDYVADYIGFDDRDALRERFRRAKRPLDDAGLRDRVSRKAHAFEDLVRAGEVRAFPGAVSLVRALRGLVPVGLCSGALPSDIDPCLRAIGLDGAFDTRVTAADVARSKPDPESYRLALERLSAHAGRALRPERSVAVEDTPAGIASARGAGLRVLAVTNSHPPEHLPADRVVVSLEGLDPASLGAI